MQLSEAKPQRGLSRDLLKMLSLRRQKFPLEVSPGDQPERSGLWSTRSALFPGGGRSPVKAYARLQIKHCLFSVEKDHWGDLQALAKSTAPVQSKDTQSTQLKPAEGALKPSIAKEAPRD